MADRPEIIDPDFEKSWHLASGETDRPLTRAEHALMRCHEGFVRWQSACLEAVSGLSGSGLENTLLHLIRMHDRPKSMTELLRMTNRDDVPNVQYALRKLGKAGLIEKQGSGRSGVQYKATAEGGALADEYARLRQSLMVEELAQDASLVSALEDAARTLNALSGHYQKAGFLAQTQVRQKSDDI